MATDIAIDEGDPVLAEISRASTAAYERFVAESKAIDYAWKVGKLDELILKMHEESMNVLYPGPASKPSGAAPAG